jgi:4-oxalocrotonate tautomerase family enzyme
VPQIKIYGLKTNLDNIKQHLSQTIHSTLVETVSIRKDKKYHRFISLDKEDMLFPEEKSYQYIIIEIIMIQGRTTETKKNLIKSLFENINKDLNISMDDIEICIIESQASNWGLRGMTGDEIKLNYKVDV